MKYAFAYDQDEKYLDEIDEIIVEYKPTDKTIESFVQLHKNKTIVFIVNNYAISDYILDICERNPNTKILINLEDCTEETLIAFQDRKIKYFFFTPATTWDMLIGIINDYKPCDVYVGGDLAFDIKDVHKYTQPLGVSIRVCPHIAQSSWHNSEDICKFFIRPEDLAFYEAYVDICEFIETDEEIYKGANLFHIYKYDKCWFGDLSVLIDHFNLEVNSNQLITGFAIPRLTCRKKCNKNNCRICFEAVEVANEMENKQFYFKQNK